MIMNALYDIKGRESGKKWRLSEQGEKIKIEP